jgi:hypothetical protein
MLIIAQPKSASTSLLKSLAKISGIKYKNGQSKGKTGILCDGFEELQKYHTTTHKRTKQFLIGWVDKKDKIYKDHILPTKKHIEYLKNKKFILLLRNPDHTIDNYIRLIKDYKNNKLSEKDIKELHLDLLLNLDFDKFCQDIKNYNKLWKESGLGLQIDYDELVMCPRRILLKCLKYLGLPAYGKIELIRAKGNHGYNTFTGIGYERAKKEWQNLHS